MMSEALAIGHREHRFEAAQDAVGAPVLGELDSGTRDIALVLLELRLEALEQRERVGGAAREACEDAVLIEAPHFARSRFHHDVAERHLAVAAERDLFAAPHGKYGGAMEHFAGHRMIDRAGEVRKARAQRLETRWGRASGIQSDYTARSLAALQASLRA